MNKKEEDQLSSIILLTAAIFASVSLSLFASLNDVMGVLLFSIITVLYGLIAIYSFYQSTQK